MLNISEANVTYHTDSLCLEYLCTFGQRRPFLNFVITILKKDNNFHRKLSFLDKIHVCISHCATYQMIVSNNRHLSVISGFFIPTFL